MFSWKDMKSYLPQKWQKLLVLGLIVLTVLAFQLNTQVGSYFTKKTVVTPTVDDVINQLKKGEWQAADLSLLSLTMSQQFDKNRSSNSPITSDPIAIEQAVAEIDKQADSLQALALIAEGQVDEGVNLLTQYTETESARHWRTLGDLLKNISVERSLAAWQKSLAIDPEQLQVHIDIIRMYRIAGDLSAANKQLVVARQYDTTPYQQTLLFDEIGNIKVQQGDLSGALEAYQQGIDIARTLAASESNSEQQRNIYVGLIKIGEIYIKQGDIDKALQVYDEGLVRAEKLAEQSPDDEQLQRELTLIRLIKGSL